MRKNRMMRLASILLVCVLLTTSVISGTFAKYVSEVTATDTARVAKWDVTMAGLAGTSAQQNFSTTFDLFKTILDTDTDAADEEVKGGMIAPGTYGSFDIVLTNNSDVDAEYKVVFSTTNSDVPLVYTVTVDGTPTDGLTSMSDFVRIDMGETKTITVKWVWPFESGADATDTNVGIAAGEFTVTATATIQQVD